jgi:hypothetical protein
MHLLPLDQQQKHNEWLNILHIAETNGYPTSIIHKLNTQIQNKVNKLPKKTELTTTTTMELLQKERKGIRMNTLESYYIQHFRHHSNIIDEQSCARHNPLLQIAYSA